MEQNKNIKNVNNDEGNTQNPTSEYEEMRARLEKSVAVKIALATSVFVAVVALIALINGVVVAFELLPILMMLGLM